MPEAYIIDAVRTPVGRRKGGFIDTHPADLGAHVIRCLVECGDFDPAAIDDVIYGCLDQIGSQAGDIARTAALAAGLPETVPGVTIDRQCGSSQQAVHFAAQAVMSGTSDLVIMRRRAEDDPVPDPELLHRRCALRRDRSVGRMARAGPHATAAGRSRSSAAPR